MASALATEVFIGIPDCGLSDRIISWATNGRRSLEGRPLAGTDIQRPPLRSVPRSHLDAEWETSSVFHHRYRAP